MWKDDARAKALQMFGRTSRCPNGTIRVAKANIREQIDNPATPEEAREHLRNLLSVLQEAT